MRASPIHSSILGALVLLVAAGCGDDGSPTGGGGGAGAVAGTWNSESVDSRGVPGSRYHLEVDGSILSGHAYWRYDGLLEHIGAVTGTVDDDGSFTWTVVLNDNGWDGTETASASVSGNTMNGTYRWVAPGGSVREEGPFRLVREPDPQPLPPGDGLLGDPGTWRGSMLYLAGGDCQATGYLWTLVFDEGSPVSEGGEVIGTAFTGRISARTFAGGAAPSEPIAYLGPLSGTIAGRRLHADNAVEFTATGDIRGTFSGGVVETATTWILSGAFVDGTPCVDLVGTSVTGGFTAVAAKVN